MNSSAVRTALAALCIAFVPAPVPADYRAGVEAYRSGDFEGAFTEWRQVAQQPPGSIDPAIRAEASYALGMLCWLGQGVVQDSTEAARWLAQAADAGHAGAQSKLGYLYLVGQGVPQSDFEALKWLRMAAHQGDADAQYNLGVMYRDGQGVPISPDRALEWFSEAAANGDAMAARVIQAYQRTGALEQMTPAEKVARFRKEPEQPEAGVVTPDWPETVEDEVWIGRRDPARYTIQVIAVRQIEGAKGFIERHPELAPFAVFRQGPESAPLWVLLQGDYADSTEARTAWRQFPTDIQPRDKLWIRSFGDVQAQLR